MGVQLIPRACLSHSEAQMMGVWAGAAALRLLLLQQLALTVTAQGIGEYCLSAYHVGQHV